MEEHREMADRAERRLEDDERRLDRLEEEIEDVREDWEDKKADKDIPTGDSAASPEGPPPEVEGAA